MKVEERFALVWKRLKAGRPGLMFEACKWQEVAVAIEWYFPSRSVSEKLLAWKDAICLIAGVSQFEVEMHAQVCTKVPPPIELAPPCKWSSFWVRCC